MIYFKYLILPGKDFIPVLSSICGFNVNEDTQILPVGLIVITRKSNQNLKSETYGYSSFYRHPLSSGT